MSTIKNSVVLAIVSTMIGGFSVGAQTRQSQAPIEFATFRHDAGESRTGPGGVRVAPQPTDPAMLVFARRITPDFDESQPAVILTGRFQTVLGEASISVLSQSSLCEIDAGANICPGLINIGPRILYSGPLCTTGEATFVYHDKRRVRSCEIEVKLQVD